MKKIKEKLAFFWYYYKIHTIVAIAVIWFIGFTLNEFFGTPKPDYEISLVSPNYLEESVIEGLRNNLVRCGKDLNGDGNVLIKMNHYQIDLTGQTDTGNNAALSALDGDLVGKYSGMFLLSDIPSFWENTHTLTYMDGSLPPENAGDFENMAIPCSQIPALAGVMQEDLFLAIRAGHPLESEYFAMLDLLKS